MNPLLRDLMAPDPARNKRIMARYHGGQKPYDPETLRNTPYVGTTFEQQVRFEKYMRQLPQVHKRFFRLKFGEKFEINGVTYQKQTFFDAVRALGPRGNPGPNNAPLDIRLWPWTKVRTCELVRDALPGGLSSADSKPMQKLPTYLDRALTPKHKDDERTGPSC